MGSSHKSWTRAVLLVVGPGGLPAGEAGEGKVSSKRLMGGSPLGRQMERWVLCGTEKLHDLPKVTQ